MMRHNLCHSSTGIKRANVQAKNAFHLAAFTETVEVLLKRRIFDLTQLKAYEATRSLKFENVE